MQMFLKRYISNKKKAQKPRPHLREFTVPGTATRPALVVCVFNAQNAVGHSRSLFSSPLAIEDSRLGLWKGGLDKAGALCERRVDNWALEWRDTHNGSMRSDWQVLTGDS